MEDWEKVEKLCSLLESLWATTQIISGSDYLMQSEDSIDVASSEDQAQAGSHHF